MGSNCRRPCCSTCGRLELRLFGVCARVTAGVLGHWLIGYFAHNQGEMITRSRMPPSRDATSVWTSILTMGECWHNNHHAFPGSARLGLFPGEWDPGWWTLLLLRRLGLAWDFRLPQDLPARAELQSIDRARRRSAGAGAPWPRRHRAS